MYDFLEYRTYRYVRWGNSVPIAGVHWVKSFFSGKIKKPLPSFVNFLPMFTCIIQLNKGNTNFEGYVCCYKCETSQLLIQFLETNTSKFSHNLLSSIARLPTDMQQ